MPNPLILKYQPKEVIAQAGRQARKAERAAEDYRVLKKAMGIFRSRLPEMLDPVPETRCFASLWPLIDEDLRQQLKSESAYRHAYRFISTGIDKGNRDGLWQLPVPTPFIDTRRLHPLRTEQWHRDAIKMGHVAERWRQHLTIADDAETLFEQMMLTAIFYGGLNRPPLWLALAQALTRARPLQGKPELCWISLYPPPGKGFATNGYDAAHEAYTISQFFPDPLTLGLLRRFLQARPRNWRPPTSQNALLSRLRKQLGADTPSLSVTLLSKAAIALAENEPKVALPEALVEYAIGRQPSTSLPTCYWERLLNPALHPCQLEYYGNFELRNMLRQRGTSSQTERNRQQRHGHSQLLNQLRDCLSKASARQSGKIGVIRKLKALEDPGWSLSEAIVHGWLLNQLEDRNNEVSTAESYNSRIGGDWLAATLEEPLETYCGEDFLDLYRSILNRPRSLEARDFVAARLMDMHQYAVIHHGLAPLPESLVESSGKASHVSAAFVDETLFAALLAHIDRFTDVDELLGRALKCFLIMAYRTGLRPGELAKLRLVDIEPSEIGWLFVSNNRYGHNKTEAAKRKVPLFELLTEAERPLVEGYIRERRLLAYSHQALVFHDPASEFEPLDTGQLSQMVRMVLADLSGGLYYRLYHLRHSALSRIQLLINRPMLDYMRRLPAMAEALPYDEDKCEELEERLLGFKRFRDSYYALAVMAGHSSPEITLSTYLHFSDFLLGEYLSKNQRQLTEHEAIALMGLKKHRVDKLLKSGPITPVRLAPYLRKRLVNFIKPLPEGGSAAAPEPLMTTDKKASHYIQCVAVLERIEQGFDYDSLVWYYRLPPDRIERWVTSAEALRGLTTSKGLSRLFPKDRRHQLLPAEPNNLQDKKDIVHALKVCQQLRKDPARITELKWAIRYYLLHSNSSRSGINFGAVADLQRFMALATRLFPWPRWHLVLKLAKGQQDPGWQCDPKLSVHRSVLRKVYTFPQGYACLYLRHAKEDERKKDGQNRYSSQSMRVLFHRLAIILFQAEEIHQWQEPKAHSAEMGSPDESTVAAGLQQIAYEVD